MPSVPKSDIARIQALADQAVDTNASQAARTKAFGEIWKSAYDNVWFAPICTQAYYWIHNKSVTGFSEMPFGQLAGFDLRYMGKRQS